MDTLVEQVKVALQKEIEKMPDGSKQKAEMLNELKKDFSSLPDLLHLPPEMTEFLYAQAIRQYQLKKWGEASSIFQVLNLLKPDDYRFPYGAAAAFHMMKDYEKAKFWYMVANCLTEDNPMILYHLSDCFMKTNQNASGKLLLETALERCSISPKYALLKERLTLIIKGMEAA